MALGDPHGKDLSVLPYHVPQPERPVYRVHKLGLSPWWYAHDDGGRFNLSSPNGTCYLAENETAAVREVAGESLVRRGVITRDFAAARVVSTLRLPGSPRLADLTSSAAADAGITREICTCVPYDQPRTWAHAIFASRFDGIRYFARFSTGAADIALAHFGSSGQAEHDADPSPKPLATVATACGIRVLPRPRTVTIIEPPTG